jgi:hemolysin activation/secretion protein
LSGQFASKNLDVSEKMELGGMSGVRAYPEGEAYADQGYLLTLEARMDLPPPPAPVPGRMQLVVFADTGHVTLDRHPWVAGTNHRTLSGAGIGVSWADAGNFLVRAFYAHKLGSASATSAPDRSGRFWVQFVKYL